MTMPDLRRDVAAPTSNRVRFRRRRVAVSALVAIATVLVTGTGAGASPPPSTPEPTVIADGLAGPLSIEALRGRSLVSQSFSGTVSTVSSDGTVTDLFSDPEGAEGAAMGPFGTVVYGSRTGDEMTFGDSYVKVRFPWGTTKLLADLGAYERANNPDAGNSYGVQGITDECAAQWPVEQFGPASYSGGIDSHAYKFAVGLFGVYVADAGANAIFFVSWSGRIHTVAVLPPQPVQLPPDPTVMGLPACVAGLTYNFEPVPTDIETTGWFSALVSLLPGGPEDASLGARGSILRLNLWNGATTTVAGGLAGATDLAVGPRGRVFVAEMFGNRISEITKSGLRTVSELPMPSAIDWRSGRLIVTYDAFGSGKVGVLTP